MNNKSFKVLLGILAMNLILQTVKESGLFPAAYAASGIQKISLCDECGRVCAEMERRVSGNRIRVETEQ
jgi:hypothetical protein